MDLGWDSWWNCDIIIVLSEVWVMEVIYFLLQYSHLPAQARTHISLYRMIFFFFYFHYHRSHLLFHLSINSFWFLLTVFFYSRFIHISFFSRPSLSLQPPENFIYYFVCFFSVFFFQLLHKMFILYINVLVIYLIWNAWNGLVTSISDR